MARSPWRNPIKNWSLEHYYYKNVYILVYHTIIYKKTREIIMNDIEKEIMKEVRDFIRVLLKKYWYILLIVIIGAVGAVVGGITVELLFIESSEIGGYGAWTFNQFSVGNSLLFIIMSIGWLLLLVVLPLCGYFALVGVIFWWKIISADNKAFIKEKMRHDDKREEKKAHKKKHAKRRGGSGGFSFFTFIIFLIVIFVQGNWLIPFGNLSYSYFILTYIEILIWIFGIGGIVGLVVFILWLSGVIGK